MTRSLARSARPFKILLILTRSNLRRLRERFRLVIGFEAEQAGAAGWNRTSDPWLRRPILYPLSYSRTGMDQTGEREG